MAKSDVWMITFDIYLAATLVLLGLNGSGWALAVCAFNSIVNLVLYCANVYKGKENPVE